MKAVQDLRFLFQQRHQKLRLRVAGIAARHKNRVDARQLLKHFAPFLQREVHCFRIRVIFVQRRIPDPNIQTVLVQQARHFHQLGRVGSEDSEIADILFPKRDRPSVIRIGFRTIAELVAAQRVLRRGGDVQIVRDGDLSTTHVHLAQQPANPEQHAPRVVGGNRYTAATSF